MAGLTSAGLEIKRAEEVRQDLTDAVRAPTGFGAGVSVRPGGPLGKLIAIISTAIGLVWEALQQVYDAFDPDQASGEALDNLAGLTGVTRLGETYTVGPVVLKGTPGTVIPAGSRVRVVNGAYFAVDADATIGGGGDVPGVVRALEPGPIEVTSGQTWQIVDLVAGWTEVQNPTALVTGRARESDADLRLRRETSLQIIGAGTDGAIRSRLQQIEGVLAAFVKSNRTNAVDADGIPPKAFEAVLYPPFVSNELVAATIFNTMPAGIEPFGLSETATVTDSQGFPQTVRWTWAEEQQVHVHVDVTTSSSYPVNGDDQVRDAIVAAAAGLSVGDDVILIALTCAIAHIPGVIGATITAAVGGAPAPGDTANLPMSYREIAIVDPANVTVSS